MCTLWERWTRRSKRRYAKKILKAIEARWNADGDRIG